jgi:signal transduction histidine kinase
VSHRWSALPLWAERIHAPAGSYGDDRLTLDQLSLVAGNLRPNHLLMPIFAAIICAMFSSWVTWDRLALWYALVIVALMPLTIVAKRFLAVDPPRAEARQWVVLFTAAIFIFTLAWGSMAVLFWVPDNDLDHTLILLMVASTLAGNSVLAGPSKPVAGIAFLTYGLVLVLLPMRAGSLFYSGFSALAVLYIGFLYYMAHVYHRMARDMLLLREERRTLVERLGKEVADLRAAELRQKETERQLLHSQKLEAIGTLAGGIAHELNNALVPILALTKLTAERLPEASRERKNIQTVHHAAERARDLVRQILAFGHKQQYQHVFFDLRGVVHQSLVLMRSTLPATIDIEERLADVPILFGDPAQLDQAVVNLVTNAAQAIGRKHGRITVTLGPAGNDPSGNGRAAVVLSVEDDGCGMDAATAARIFEPFFTTKKVGDGTGLGLSVVHGIIAGHGGDIVVKSAPGDGARFEIYLPLPAEAEADTPAAAAELTAP